MNKQVANVQLMQRMNRLKVLNYVRVHPDCSRPTISKDTGLSLASITNITSYLLDIGILNECGTEDVGRVGRKSTLLRFTHKAYKLICVFISEGYINIYVSDLLGNAINKSTISTDGLSGEKILSLACDSVGKIANSFKKGEILAVGIAVSALVLENSKFIFSSKLKWKTIDIKAMFEESTNLPVFVNNISPIRAAWHFCLNSNPTIQNMLFLDLENGIGAVWYADGHINSNALGEIGHTTVEKDGEPCFCGNRGCLEAMCSPKRLFSLYESSSGERINSLSEMERLYKEGDKSAEFAINECAKYLGIGLANLVNLFNPSSIVINTGDFTDCPTLIKTACEQMNSRAFVSLTQSLIVETVTVSEDRAVYGMAYNLCDKIFDISSSYNIIE